MSDLIHVCFCLLRLVYRQAVDLATATRRRMTILTQLTISMAAMMTVAPETHLCSSMIGALAAKFKAQALPTLPAGPRNNKRSYRVQGN